MSSTIDENFRTSENGINRIDLYSLVGFRIK